MLSDKVRFEAAKKVIEEFGYKIIKKNTTPHILSCPICDKKSTKIYICFGEQQGTLRACRYCGFEGYVGSSTKDSIIKWNEAVKDCIAAKGVNDVENR